MKKIFSYLAASLFIMTLMVTTGCEDDPVITLPNDPPIITIGSSSSVIDGGSVTVAPGDTVGIQIIGTPGTDILRSITFRENGSNIDIARLDELGGNIGSAVALLEGTTNENGFTWDVVITAADVDGIYDYDVTLEDVGGLTGSVIFSFVVETPIVTTPLDVELSGVLFNQAGPVGKGAIDLDSGFSTGITSTDPDTGTTPDMAELRDLGIDPTIDPNVSENWRAQIAGVNGTEVRILTAPSAENFTFAGVTTKEQIIAEWDAADLLPNVEDVGGVMTDVSDPVIAGDIFVIRDLSDRIFMVEVTSVDPVSGSNDDSYTLAIKQ